MTAAPTDGNDASPDETTLADDEWPVSDLYRVESPGPDAGPDDLGTSPTVVAPARARPQRPRWDPFHDGRFAALALVLLAVAALAVAAGVYLAGGGESAEAPPPAGAATGPTSTPSETSGSETTPSAAAASTPPLPDLTGVDLREARDVLGEAGLRVRVRRLESDQPAGDVIAQQPAAGAKVSAGGLVTLTVSSGPAGATVPDVVGEPVSTARRRVQEEGLRVEIARVASSKAVGTVIRQSPEAGTDVDDGSVVSLQVAKPRPPPAAPTTIDVPRLTGLDVSDARARLRELGLRSTVTRVDSQKPAGTVVEQSPSAGSALERGDAVELTVSAGPAPVAVPDVVGLDEASARAQLESAGFEVETVDEPTTDPIEDGQVVGQSPSAGSSRKPGSLVTLRVARLG